MRPLTGKEIRQVERLRQLAGEFPDNEVKVQIFDDDSGLCFDLELSSDLLRTILANALTYNEGFTTTWRSEFPGPGRY